MEILIMLVLITWYMANIEIPEIWFYLILGAILGAIIWPMIQFLILPWKRTKRRIEDMEKDAGELKDKIDKYGREVFALAEQVQNSLEIIQTIEQRIKFIADKIGLKGDLLSWGRLMFLEGNLDESIGAFSKLLDSEPSNDSARFYRGLCYLRKGRRHIKDAVEDLKIAVKANGKDPERRLALSRAYLDAGMSSEAEMEAMEALDLGVSDSLKAKEVIGRARLLKRDYDGAINTFKECPLTHTPTVTGWGKALFEKARRAFSEKKREIYTSIITHYTEAIKLNPHVADYYTFRARAYAERNEQGDWNKALEDWEEAKTIAPRDTKPWKAKGDAIYQRAISLPEGTKRDAGIKEALINYGEALKRAPESYRPAIRNKRSIIYLSQGKFDMALSEAKAGTKENPNYVTNFMAWATAAISAFAWKEVVDAANSGLEIAMKIRSYGAVIWCLLFRIIGRCGDFQPFENILEDCNELAINLEDYPSFDSTERDFSVAKERLNHAMKDWPTDMTSIVRDSIVLVEKDLSLSIYRQKHLKNFKP